MTALPSPAPSVANTPADAVNAPTPELVDWSADVHRMADKQGIAAGTTSERLCALATSLGRLRQ
jgi:hypothetical protein